MHRLFLANGTIETENPAFVMGIVNATPDSFWEGSRGGVDHALQLIDEGADILDIGGESTRPGSDYVTSAEEFQRVIPLVRAIRRYSDIPISIDTRKYEIMKPAFYEGADILNDVSALEDDEKTSLFAAEVKIPVILMHKRGVPKTMHFNEDFNVGFSEVSEYLERRAEFALSMGIEPEKIIVDPGIGFGKNLRANIELIKNCGSLCGGAYPVLMALSRKRCIGEMTGRDVGERLCGTLAANVISVLNGATLLRVHDVKETIDTLNVLRYTI